MGLDLLEFIFSVEEVFNLYIPEADAQVLDTPRRLIDYLTSRLPDGLGPDCLSQRAFYRLRIAICEEFHCPRQMIRPGTDLLQLAPKGYQPERWREIGRRLGAEKYWPRLAKPGWFENAESPRLSLVRDIVRFMCARNLSALLDKGEGWTRKRVADVVHKLIREQLGIPRGEYTEDSRWTEDMGIE
jgi:acyl carrier protein